MAAVLLGGMGKWSSVSGYPVYPNGKPVIKIAEIKNGISAQTKFTQQQFDAAVRVKAGDLLFS